MQISQKKMDTQELREYLHWLTLGCPCGKEKGQCLDALEGDTREISQRLYTMEYPELQELMRLHLLCYERSTLQKQASS